MFFCFPRGSMLLHMRKIFIQPILGWKFILPYTPGCNPGLIIFKPFRLRNLALLPSPKP